MKIKMTLVRPGSTTVDLSVTAEPGTQIGDLARQLGLSDPAGPTSSGTHSAVTLRVHQRNDATGTAGARILDHDTTLADSGLASGAVVSLAPTAGDAAQSSAKLVATVSVLAGPDVGKRFALRAGSSTIGRDPQQKIVLSDPLVSKLHARLNITDVAEVIDLGSANGTLVNGEQLDRLVLSAGDQITVGDTVLVVDIAAQAAAEDVGGAVYLNRSPRLDPQYPGRKFKAPDSPEKPKPQRLPWLALLAPLVMGAVLYFVTRNLLSIIFVGLSPILMAGTYIDSRIQAKRQWKAAKADFETKMQAMENDVDQEHSIERTGRLKETPSVADVVADTRARDPLLWTRRPEHDAFLKVRLGLGTMPSRVEMEIPTDRKGAPELWHFIEDIGVRAATVDGVPVVESLLVSGNLGIAGSALVAGGVARGVVAQFAALHSPAELVIVAAASMASSADWAWLKWLPHVGSAHSPLESSPLATGGQGTAALVSELEGLVAQRLESKKDNSAAKSTLPIVLFVIEDDAPFERARLVDLAERGPSARVHLLWVSPSLARLPAACRTFLELTPATGEAMAGYVHTGYGVLPVVCENLSVAEAMDFARDLAPLVDAGARVDDSSDLPRSVSLLHVLGTELGSDPEAILGRWQETNSVLTGPRASTSIGRNKSNLRAVFGQGSAEPFAIDLRADGPHALVGGTTGSGKSEFLQAWVLGLAAAHSPQRVSFLFVDYKGGSAFADCVSLPHTVGLVTDLSPHLVRRALTSLRAELRFREHLLNLKKAKDLVELERMGDPEVPPSLLIVIDEFAALVNEVPDFVDGVVDVAQRGRSLGLHLILATQRPAGVIRDNLRANTNLRVALRMADEDDSTDVLGTPMAASFDPSIPGRGAAKTGPGRIKSFQSGYAGGWTSDVPEPGLVVIEELQFGLPVVWETPIDPAAEAAKDAVGRGPTDIQRMVRTVKKAALEAQIPDPRKPWLPELASTYDFSKLPNKRTDDELVLGVVDDAAHQSQPIVSYFPDRDGNMAIVGTGGSGKSTTLRTIAISSAVTMRGGPVHVYGLDFAAGGLQMLESLPHVGSIINGDDEERVARLLRWLRDLVDQRAVKYAEARAGNIVDYRKITSTPDEPRILLLLDGMSAFRETYESSVISPWFSVFSQIATDGRAVGVHVIVTGDRSGSIPMSLSSSIQRRLVLRMASADDYGMLGVPADVLGPMSPPGRGVLDDRETQVAVLGGDSNVAIQAREIDALALAMTKARVASAPAIERLSDDISLASLPVDVGATPTLGVADDNLAPVGLDPVGGFVIAGPPGSGRTTALRTLAESIHRVQPSRQLYLLSPRRSALTRLGVWTKSADSDEDVVSVASELQAELQKKGTAPGSIAIFLENIAEFAGHAAEFDLEAMVKLAIKNGQFVAGEAETSTWSQAYSLGTPLRAGRRGLLLQPDDSDGDMLLNTSTGRIKRSSFPTGRGFLIGQGRARKIQVATPLDEGAGTP